MSLAQKHYAQAKSAGHRLLAENWSERMREFEKELDVIRLSIRRMDRLAAETDLAKDAAE